MCAAAGNGSCRTNREVGMEWNSTVHLADFPCNMGKASLHLNWFKPIFLLYCGWFPFTVPHTGQDLIFRLCFLTDNLCHINIWSIILIIILIHNLEVDECTSLLTMVEHMKWNSDLWNTRGFFAEKSMYVTKTPEITSGSLTHCKDIVHSKN